ncbi:hypothetical protein ACFX2H_003303 [Malus domestica]
MMILPYTVYALAGQERWCCLLCSCRPGALVPFAVSARAGKECLVLPFMLVQTRSFVPCSLGSCKREVFGVAFYACADQELCAMQFRLMQARSLGSCSLGSCEQGALVRAV